jgi:hypothetical protein
MPVVEGELVIQHNLQILLDLAALEAAVLV